MRGRCAWHEALGGWCPQRNHGRGDRRGRPLRLLPYPCPRRCEWAKWIAWQLEEHVRFDGRKAQVFLEAWDIVPGSDLVANISRMLDRSDRVVPILSPHYFADPGDHVWPAAWTGDQDRLRRIVPVRVEACVPTGLLRTIHYIDLVGMDAEAAAAALRTRMSDAIKGRLTCRRRRSERPAASRLPRCWPVSSTRWESAAVRRGNPATTASGRSPSPGSPTSPTATRSPTPSAAGTGNTRTSTSDTSSRPTPPTSSAPSSSRPRRARTSVMTCIRSMWCGRRSSPAATLSYRWMRTSRARTGSERISSSPRRGRAGVTATSSGPCRSSSTPRCCSTARTFSTRSGCSRPPA